MFVFFRIPFPFQTPIVHACVYLYVVVSTYPYINPILSVDALFLGCALHIGALFRGLHEQAKSLELEKIKANDRQKHWLFLQNIKSFVARHSEIIELVRQMEQIFSGIFIVQFMGAMCSICIQAYLSTLVSG